MDEDAKKWLIVGLVVLVLGLGGLAFFKTPAKPPASPGSAPVASPSAEVGVRPDIVINRTKAVAGQVERNRNDQEEP